MLGKLFKPRWQHRNAEVRLQAVTMLDAHKDQETLAKLAQQDESPKVRAAAVASLQDLNLLDGLIGKDNDDTVRTAASERFMALLAGTVDGAPAVATRQRLIEHTDNASVLLHVVYHSPDLACRQAALTTIEEPQTLYQIAIEGGDTDLRMAAAERLDDDALLRQLGRKGRDKKVVRMARDRIKARQAEHSKARQLEEQIDAVIEALEQLTQQSNDPLFEGRLQQLEQRWQSLAENSDTENAVRAERALHECKAHLHQQQEARAQEAALESAKQERDAALDALRMLYRDLSSDTWDQQLGELRSAVATQERRWQAASEVRGSDDESDLAFHSQLTEWRRLIALAQEASDTEDEHQRQELAAQWPAQVAAPSILAAAFPAKPSQDTETAPPEPPRKQKRSRHYGLVVALRRELNKGNLKHANRLWLKAESVLSEEQDSWLQRQLERLSARRHELQDWHAFAAQPKKDQLCDRMEALADADMDPAELATAIQALHEEWRALMSSDQDQDQELWDRFKTASDKAYEPCRAHFEELDAQRAKNLEQRRVLCQQLADFIASQDWQKADWQAVWEIRRQAPQEWKSHAPVRFTEVRDLQKHFSALLSEIDQHLDHAWQEAEAQRQTLLDQANTLAEWEDVHAAAREAQSLQKQWRTTPWLPPARHRSFQKRFRRIMDGIFSARQTVNEQREAQKQEAAGAAETLLKQVGEQADRPLAEQDNATLTALINDVDAIDDAPLSGGIRKQKQRLQEKLQKLRVELPRWRRWQTAHDKLINAPAGDSRAEDRTLAAALEVLANVEGPEDARQERLAWQLEQLPRAMKSNAFAPLDEALKLIEERPAETPLDTDLARRMDNALVTLTPQV